MDMNWEPPRNIDILYNIHKIRTTHIKKPFHYKQFPYQYKNKYYYQYTNTNINEVLELNELDRNEIIDVELDTLEPKSNLQNSINKNLKQKIYNHQLYFYEDFIEYNITKDYCKLFNKSFNIPRQDWASPYHFFYKPIPINTNYSTYTTHNFNTNSHTYTHTNNTNTTVTNTRGTNITNTNTNTRGTNGEEKNSNKIASVTNFGESNTNSNKGNKDTGVGVGGTGGGVSGVGCGDTDTVTDDEIELNINELRYIDEIKRRELLNGEIPELFDRKGLIKLKQKKDCWISYHNLKNYALMIDSVTKCPLLIVQSKKFLQKGWYTDKSTNTTGDVGDTVCDTVGTGGTGGTVGMEKYNVKKEIIEEVNKILKERREIKEEELPDVTKLFKSKSYGINENCYTIGGGRYHI